MPATGIGKDASQAERSSCENQYEHKGVGGQWGSRPRVPRVPDPLLVDQRAVVERRHDEWVEAAEAAEVRGEAVLVGSLQSPMGPSFILLCYTGTGFEGLGKWKRVRGGGGQPPQKQQCHAKRWVKTFGFEKTNENHDGLPNMWRGEGVDRTPLLPRN